MKNSQKTIVITIIIIAIIILGIWLYITTIRSTNSVSTPGVSEATSSSPSTLEATSPIMVPYTFSIPHTSFVINSDSIKNPKTGDIVTFVSSEAESGTAMAYDVLLNGTRIGIVVGYADSDPVFSPSDRYASFESTAPEGSGGEEYVINVIDFQSRKVILVPSPQHFNSLLNGENDVIESYSWDSTSDALNVTAFAIEVIKGKLYRISPEQMWQYNLVTSEYTLIQKSP